MLQELPDCLTTRTKVASAYFTGLQNQPERTVAFTNYVNQLEAEGNLDAWRHVADTALQKTGTSNVGCTAEHQYVCAVVENGLHDRVDCPKSLPIFKNSSRGRGLTFPTTDREEIWAYVYYLMFCEEYLRRGHNHQVRNKGIFIALIALGLVTPDAVPSNNIIDAVAELCWKAEGDDWLDQVMSNFKEQKHAIK